MQQPLQLRRHQRSPGGVSLKKDGIFCSSGLSVIKGSTKYSTTNGHCWYGETSGLVTSGTEAFGSLNSSTYLFPGSFCDCRLVTATSPSWVKNRLYYSDADENHAITSKRTYSNEGDSVRLSGRSTQGNGTVAYIDFDYTSSTCGCIIKGAILATYASVLGDSGGAVTSIGGGIAVGINAAKTAGYGLYFEVDNIQAQMGVTVLITG